MKRRPAPRFSGHLHFVTTSTHQRTRVFSHPTLCNSFLKVLHELHQKHAFGLYAYVLMPDHIHLIVQPRDGRISILMSSIKSLSARKILAELREKKKSKLLEKLRRFSGVKRGRTHQVWQQGFHTVELWNEWFIQKKIDYLHANPLRAGLAESARDYPWSSFQAFHGLGKGGIPIDSIPL